MRLRYIKSACVVVEHGGTRILCDPWLTDGIYYGSWHHYPPLTVAPEDFASVDGIYISHIHPDHLDVATLQRLPRAIPVFIHDYEQKFVLRTLQGLGFTGIREIPHGGRAELGGGLTLEIFAADGCDPALCGKLWGCTMAVMPGGRTQQIDSLAVFSAGGRTIVNTNDCPYELARHAVCDDVIRRHGHVDLLLTGYGGAGPFPQCFSLPPAEKERAAIRKRQQFLEQAAQFIKHLRPSFYLPFAGQYTLGGRLADLNPYRGVPELEELPELLPPLVRAAAAPSTAGNGRIPLEIDTSPPPDSGEPRMVLLNPGEHFDLSTLTASKPFAPPDPGERQRYIDEVLRRRPLAYEANPTFDDRALLPLLLQAQERMWRHQRRLGYASAWRAYIDTGSDMLFCLPFDGVTLVTAVPRGAEEEPFVRIGLPEPLLRMILDRKAHWNNAEIGSHLSFERRPDSFERGLHYVMSYLHC